MYSLDTSNFIQLNESKAEHSKYKDASEYSFQRDYIKSSNGIVINPRNGNIGKAFNASIQYISNDHSKVLTLKDYEFTLHETGSKYEYDEEHSVNIGVENFSQSY